MDYGRLLLSILAVWRITHLLSKEDGPWDAIFLARQKIRMPSLASLLDCFYCLSLWIAVPFAVWTSPSWLQRAILCPALSGAAILVERLTTEKHKQSKARDNSGD